MFEILLEITPYLGFSGLDETKAGRLLPTCFAGIYNEDVIFQHTPHVPRSPSLSTPLSGFSQKESGVTRA